jgi:hypothetical protein
MTIDLASVARKVRDFENTAAAILGVTEGSVLQRAFNAHDALVKVSGLSIDQAELLKQSVRCIEVGVFRGAIVLAWAAIADIVLKLAVKNASVLSPLRPNWALGDQVQLAESTADHAIIEALKAAGVITKGEMKSLHGMLHKRNECAHPSNYFPGANEALGFLDETIKRATDLSAKL